METLKPLKEPRVLDRETKDKVVFMTFIIQMFARAYKMSGPKAYLYLKQYGGMDFLNECWWALHIDNPVYAVHDMYLVCRNNGGMR
ncbi:MAG: DUF3791 domain-containing protein [Tannerellaceae bacterium]|jgi:hypothetical protein|nr:DUF3791 domain-containing protein [Tannerellaceae bacterium]